MKFWSGELPTLADMKLKFEVEVLKNMLFIIYLRYENLSSQKCFQIFSIRINKHTSHQHKVVKKRKKIIQKDEIFSINQGELAGKEE